jgi:LPS-assembly protein
LCHTPVAQAQTLTRYEDYVPAAPSPVSFESTADEESVPGPGYAPILPAAESPSQVALMTRYEETQQAPRMPAKKEGSTEGAEKTSAVPGQPVSSDPVDLVADSLVHDDKAQVITAAGNVILEQSGRILRADEVSYSLATDVAVARGHVVLNEINGDIHYAEEVTLNNKMKDGFVIGLKTYLSDGSRFSAAEGERANGVKTTMHDATYTPCEPCKAHPDRPPVWQIRASEVAHDNDEKKISYKNARFEVYGVPVAYTPYFSHPDGSIKRKSGLLAPAGGFKSGLGAFVENKYYWDIAPNKDATIGVMAMTKEAPLMTGEWRQRWEDATLEVQGGVTYSGSVENKAGVDVAQDEKVRGHVLANGLWDIDDKWRAGLDVARASDDQYMRQYDFVNDDVLESQLYAERFSGRNYAAGRLIAFQDVRVRDRQADQPQVLPEIEANFLGEPDSMPVLGGRWGVKAAALGLRRSGADQDMSRFSLRGGWQKRMVSDYGMLTTVNASTRADVYNTRDRVVATPGSGQSNQTTEARLYPNLHVQSSYPAVRTFDRAQVTIEPLVALTVSPNIDVSNDIPNEDSQDVQIDASNLFEPNRFPGVDRIEDKSRVTYGVRSGIYGYDGSRGDVFLGQSHRLDKDDNPFPEGSGLDKQDSDIVGQLSAQYKDDYSMDYRFQLSSNNLASQRHEINSVANWDRFRLSGRYLFAKALGGTDIDESREQLQAAAAYYVTEDWRVRTGGTQDLGDEPGLRKAYVGLDYFGQCLSWSLIGQRNLTDDATGESDTEILFRIGLKNLSEFESSGLRTARATE